VPALSQQFGFKNAFAVPRLEKIVLSMGLGRFAVSGGEGKGNFEKAERELTVIAGQKPVRTLAKKSVANFKVREGMETGLKVTLRGGRMYEFLDRLIALAIPRVKDFRGLDPNGFDKSGNYNMGFGEQTIFPEVNSAEVTFQQGLNITMVTTAQSPEHGRELLKQFGFPFREHSKLEGR
jgi:large subunit ribosomal protein L5